MYAEKLSLGFSSRSDAIVTSMTGKAEGSKKESSIKPGDLLVLEATTGNVSTVTKAADLTTCCIYGVASIGIQQFTIPVLIKGHVIANLDSSVFTDIKIGEALTCANKGAQKCCCNVFVVQKIKALNAVKKEFDSYELLLR